MVGDYSTSVIKPSSMSKIVRKKVFCKTIPKSKIEDIIPVMESTLYRYHTKALILHIGSNNISNQSVESTIREMEKISSEIKLLLPETKIAISGCVATPGSNALRIPYLNQEVRVLCRKFGIQYINNTNIPSTCHKDASLDDRGSLLLSNNMAQNLKSQL